jgi:hypothetical protein
MTIKRNRPVPGYFDQLQNYKLPRKQKMKSKTVTFTGVRRCIQFPVKLQPILGLSPKFIPEGEFSVLL